MDYHQSMGVLAGIVSLAGFAPYCAAILSRGAAPCRSTWAIWTLVGAMLCASYWGGGARETIWVALSYVAGPLVVAILSLRFGTGGASLLDRLCLLVSAGSAVVWAATGEPILALLLNILVDAAGAVPTIVKAWRDPDSEDRTAWRLFLTAAALNLLALRDWDLSAVSYPAYLFCVAATVVALSSRHPPGVVRR